jgi:LPXTG-motif cell wall-anchored protein
MNKQKRIGTLALLTVMLLSMAVFSSPALASGEPATTPTPAATPVTATKTLTPEGNLTLVDDIDGGKQFITVVTKSGNYFYIIIDRASESENVYFLNKVDEADLMAILEENGYEIATTPTPTPTPTPRVIVNPDTVDEAGTSSNNSLMLLITLLAVGGGGAYLFFKKKKAAQKTPPRAEDFGYDYEYEDEEEDAAEEEKPKMDEAVKRTGKWDGVV